MLKIEHCEKCINVKDLKDHWAIAGYYCPLDCQWSGSDHHSHSLCEACGDNFKNAYIARQKYGLQRQLDAQLLRRKKDEAAHVLSVVTYEQYRNKFNTYLNQNWKKQNDPLVVAAQKKHFSWISVSRPQDYKYHCENQCCLRPLKSTHVKQVKNKLYCHPCSRSVSLNLIASD